MSSNHDISLSLFDKSLNKSLVFHGDIKLNFTSSGADKNLTNFGNGKISDYDGTGALLFVVSVITVYSLSMFMIVITLVRRKSHHRQMDIEVNKYLKGINDAKRQARLEEVLRTRLHWPGNLIWLRYSHHPERRRDVENGYSKVKRQCSSYQAHLSPSDSYVEIPAITQRSGDMNRPTKETMGNLVVSNERKCKSQDCISTTVDAPNSSDEDVVMSLKKTNHLTETAHEIELLNDTSECDTQTITYSCIEEKFSEKKASRLDIPCGTICSTRHHNDIDEIEGSSDPLAFTSSSSTDGSNMSVPIHISNHTGHVGDIPLTGLADDRYYNLIHDRGCDTHTNRLGLSDLYTNKKSTSLMNSVGWNINLQKCMGTLQSGNSSCIPNQVCQLGDYDHLYVKTIDIYEPPNGAANGSRISHNFTSVSQDIRVDNTPYWKRHPVFFSSELL